MLLCVQQLPSKNDCSLSVTLPMYNLPELRASNAAFWKAMTYELTALGRADVPQVLSFTRPAVPDRIGPEVYFSQTCGYPLRTVYSGQYRLLGVPTYELPGCGPGSHCAFVVVNKDADFQTMDDLRGKTFAVNSQHSNSGMNLPRRLIATLANGRPFFSRVVETGTHPASMALVSSGDIDAASIDCVTFALFSEHQPEVIRHLRVLAETPASPTIPFITSIETSDRDVEFLREALQIVGNVAKYRSVRQPLSILSIAVPDPAVYDVLPAYEYEAAAMGYPALE